MQLTQPAEAMERLSVSAVLGGHWRQRRSRVDLREHVVGKKPRTIDEFLAGLSDDKRAALEKLRQTIRAAAPKAQECISYGVPAFRLDGKFLVAFGAGVSHCAFYPGGTAMEAHRAELARYDTSKGTIRFEPKAGLPVGLVRRIVKSRIVALQE